ncbi:MAG: hypothetical protein ACK4RK_20595 [Gemmataceae bacterium]
MAALRGGKILRVGDGNLTFARALVRKRRIASPGPTAKGKPARMRFD